MLHSTYPTLPLTSPLFFSWHEAPSMAAKTLSSFFTNLFFFLLHIGCFLFTIYDPTLNRKKRKSPSSPTKLISSSWSFLTRVFSVKRRHVTDTHPSSPRSSYHSVPPPSFDDPPRKRRTGSRSESDLLTDNLLLPLRNDIFPCSSCGEIFQSAHLLDHHGSTQHAVSELQDSDPSKNVVLIIFNTGWKGDRVPKIHRILKIHNGTKILARFEEYREIVKMKAAAARNDAVWRQNERCLVDGNELLRFHCTTFACDLGQNGKSALCGNQYCSVCEIIRAGFSGKLDGISTLATGWKAHVAVPDDVEAEFAFMSVKRAMLVCRVVAGRVGEVEKGEPGFDSLANNSGEGSGKLDGEDELLVFNPRAVLPCFVIVYSV